MRPKGIIFFITTLYFIVLPLVCLAQTVPRDEIFRAEVLEVLNEEQTDGGAVQQNLRLLALDGDFRGEEFEFDGIGSIDVIKNQQYEAGDKVLAAASYDAEGNVYFYVLDYVRTPTLWWLAGLFLAVLLLVGRWKGLRSLLALALTFLIIIKYIVPQILSGANPLITTVLGSFIILLVIIYVTEGFKPRAHLSAAGIFIGLILTVALAQIFVSLARFTGAAGEETLFLLDVGGGSINLAGLLLAGIIIGTLGVLDDVVISQVAAVEEIHAADKKLSQSQLFKKAYSVGVSHIASMTNTLFLAYAGASLPLLILFVSGSSAFAGWQQALNTELIATEVVRTLAGSIGLILSVPIATYIAAWWFKKKSI